MGKGRKRTPSMLVFLKGLLLSLGVYLPGLLLAALLAVKGVLREEGLFPAVAVLCILAALAGGFLCARRPVWGPLPSAMVCAVLFAGILAAVGILCWEDGITWSGHGGVLVLCALAGGLLAGILGSGRKRRRKVGSL